jgi:hypothetical protein
MMRYVGVRAVLVVAAVLALAAPAAAPAMAAPVRAALAMAAPAGAVSAGAAGPSTPADTVAAPDGLTGSPIPALAYYYMWYDVTSWDRAKIDYPQLGRYSSDDPNVIRQHMTWAKSAGITGFILSWKDTPTYDRRLRLLMSLANELHFSVAMIYEGLDFNRHPLPVDRVAQDFRTFADRYASDPSLYRIGGKALTILSGTWQFSHDDIARVTGPVRDKLLVLATAKNTDDYVRVADVTDGDAYYWSSVNPQTNSRYGDKLVQLAQSVHARRQYWIAPFAPGFDARLVGGSKVVERNNGTTLRIEYATAVASSPDILGLISWNEWSENSYVEPSHAYGFTELDALRNLRGVAAPVPPSSADSSGSAATADAGSPGPLGSSWPNLLPLAGFLLFLLVAGIAVRIRISRSSPAPDDAVVPGDGWRREHGTPVG